MAPVLYKLDGSPPSCAVRMLADLIGLPLELKSVDWITMEHKSADYVQMNPLGTLPVLIDGELVISDSHAIMLYLLQQYGGAAHAQLYPSDAATRALVNQALFFDAGILFIRLKVVALPTLMHGLQGPSEKHLSDIEEAYGFVESYLRTRKYIACEHMTVADLSVGATMAALQKILTLDAAKFPRTAEWFAAMDQQPFFRNMSSRGAALFAESMRYYWKQNSQK